MRVRKFSRLGDRPLVGGRLGEIPTYRSR